MENEKELLIALSKGDEKALELFFTAYYKNLLLFAGTYIKDAATCEDITQQVFVNLWEKRAAAANIVSIRSFLLKAVQNACLNELRRLDLKKSPPVTLRFMPKRRKTISSSPSCKNGWKPPSDS